MSSTSTTVSAHTQTANFSSIPILDYSLASSPSTKPLFISQLQHALINVGFLYLSNHTVPASTIDPLLDYIPKFFALPQEEKEKIWMGHTPHFLGYGGLDAESTRGKVDHREFFEFSTKCETRWREGDEEYLKMYGPSQWPDESVLPGFRAVLERYTSQLKDLADSFIPLIAESLCLPPGALNKFYDARENMLHRTKLNRYPPVAVTDSENDQGVGPHYDYGFLVFLLQVSKHTGLQVQNLTGEWIDVPTVPGTFVVNIGRALEVVTQGLARATSHRALAPKGATEPRYSVPFFQNIRMDIKLIDNILDLPPEVLKLKEARGRLEATDSINLREYDWDSSGQAFLVGKAKTHTYVTKRHYPQLFKKYCVGTTH